MMMWEEKKTRLSGVENVFLENLDKGLKKHTHI